MNKPLNNVMETSFNPYLKTVIMTYVGISVVLMVYAFLALFVGMSPLKTSNPFAFQNVTRKFSVLNLLRLIFNIAVAVGVLLFVYIGSKDILEQRVIFD